MHCGAGLVIGVLMLLTVVEPRKPGETFLGDPLHSSKFTSPNTRGINASADDALPADGTWLRPKPASPVSRTARKREEREGMMASVKSLLTSRAFQVLACPRHPGIRPRTSCLVLACTHALHAMPRSQLNGTELASEPL